MSIIQRVPWNIQPAAPVPPDPYWISRGLAYVWNGRSVIYSKSKASSTGTVTGGPKPVAGKYGIGTGFGSTSGSGSTDSLLGPTVTAMPSYRSFVVFYQANSLGGSSLGRVMQSSVGNGTDASSSEGIWFQPTGISYNRSRGVGTQDLSIAVHTLVAGEWVALAVASDQTSPGITPRMIVNGVAATVTPTAGAGAFNSVSYTMMFGNRADGTRTFDGVLGPQLYFDSFLTDTELISLSNNPWQIFAPLPRRIWVPSAGTGTTSATIAETDGPDSASIATTVTTGAAIAATDGADTAAVNAATWTTAQIAATDGADAASVAASVTTGAAIVGTDGADSALIAAATWTTAQIAATDAADASAITTVLGSVTTAAIAASDGADAASVFAATWTTALLAAIDGADNAAMVAGNVGTTSAGISVTEGADIMAIGVGSTGPLILAGSLKHATTLAGSARMATTLRGSCSHV